MVSSEWSGSEYTLEVGLNGFADGLDMMLKKKSVMKHQNICPKQMEGWRKTTGKAGLGVGRRWE